MALILTSRERGKKKGETDVAFFADEFEDSPSPVTEPPVPKGLSFFIKGGPGSGNWEAPGQPRYARDRGFSTAKDRNNLPDHIKALKIPPAWKKVRYNPNPKGDLLATGVDAKGRKQYIYSEKYNAQQADKKFGRINQLMNQYDAIVKINEKNRASSNRQTRDNADCLKLIMETGLRPGSDKDTKASKKAYGATTLLGEHVTTDGKMVSLTFVGKKGVSLSISVGDPALKTMLLSRKKAAGDKGKLFNTDSSEMLTYTKGLSKGKFKTKDFRTRLANDLAMSEVSKYGATKPKSQKEYKKMVKDVATIVSKQLGNTPTVALQSYIHPAVFAEWRV
jgi:DNA topoisomerase-1